MNISSKLRKTVCVSALLLAIPFCSTFAATGEINSNEVRLRKEPSTEAKIITLMEKGKKVEVLGESNGWYQVKCGNNNGWVLATLIDCFETVQTVSSTAVAMTNEAVGTTTETVANESVELISEAVVTEEVEIKIVAVTGSTVNLRKEPTTDSTVVGKVVEGDNLIVVETVSNGEWYKVQFGDIEGYVFAELVTEDLNEIKGTGKVNDTVNFRSEPTTDATVISKLKPGTSVTVLDTQNEWYKILYNDQEGWVVARCVDRVTSTTSRSGSNSVASRVVELAKAQLGKKYVWGAEGPNSFDCSGLMQFIFGKVGISLNRVSYDQVTQGIKVAKANLIPGDLVFFSGINSSNSSKVSHVGVYIGGNEFIHAANPNRGVVKDSLSDTYYTKHYVTARRVIR